MGIFDKIKGKIDERFNPNHQKAYESFSESAKKEMAESLKLVDTMDLYSLKLNDLWEHTVSSRWDSIDFKEWVVQKDEIWKYIIINWTKCREYQPWISWFVYEDVRSKYSPNERLRVWFCDKWVFKKSVTIDASFWAKIVDMIPSDVTEQLWWHLYVIEDTNAAKEGALHNIEWDDIFYVEYDEKSVIAPKEEIRFKDEIIHKDGSKTSLKINWTTFKEYTPWTSWFVYKEFFDSREGIGAGDCLLLAEYKDWKMVWEWIIVTSTKKIYPITSGK